MCPRSLHWKNENNFKNTWKDVLCSGTGRLNIVKTATFPKLIYGFEIIQ